MRDIDDQGYATPAAMVLSLALATVGAALASRSLQMLSHAKQDLEATRQAIAFDGAQLTAATAVIRSGEDGPFAWRLSTELGWTLATAEPEVDKLDLQSLAALDDSVLAALGAADPAGLRSRAQAAAAAETPIAVADLDAGAVWRDCGPSLASAFGTAERFAYAARTEPTVGMKPARWRIGEVWRIRIATPTGWRDDRIVRFTGNARHPVAVVVRKFSKSEGDGARCEGLLEAAAG